MKNALLIVTVLVAAIMSTACINNFAVQELNNKAQEYIAKGDYESAIGRLEASIDIDPAIFETNYNLGIAALSAEKYEKAIQAFENAAELRPTNADVYYSLAVAQYNYAEKLFEDNSQESDAKNVEDEELSKKVSQFYGASIMSLEKYLSFENISSDSKEKALSQLETIKNKFSELNKAKG